MRTLLVDATKYGRHLQPSSVVGSDQPLMSKAVTHVGFDLAEEEPFTFP